MLKISTFLMLGFQAGPFLCQVDIEILAQDDLTSLHRIFEAGFDVNAQLDAKGNTA